jgi:hypothetical protein
MAKLNNIEEKIYIDLYDPEDNYLGTTNNELSFNDFRLQIIEENKEGYYFIKRGPNFTNKKIYIKSNGRIENGSENYPFTLYQTQLAKIITEGAKNDQYNKQNKD